MRGRNESIKFYRHHLQDNKPRWLPPSLRIVYTLLVQRASSPLALWLLLGGVSWTSHWHTNSKVCFTVVVERPFASWRWRFTSYVVHAQVDLKGNIFHEQNNFWNDKHLSNPPHTHNPSYTLLQCHVSQPVTFSNTLWCIDKVQLFVSFQQLRKVDQFL